MIFINLKRILIMVGIMAGLSAMASSSQEILISEDFQAWQNFKFSEENKITEYRGWRIFNTNDAKGSFECIHSRDESFLRISRLNNTGDSAIDLDSLDNRILINPGTNIFIRVFARSASKNASIDIRIAEYNGNNFLGIDNEHTFKLGKEFQPYVFQIKTSAKTSEINAAIRIPGTTSIDIKAIEVGILEKLTKPCIQLPQGRCLNKRPVLWWKGSAHKAHQIQISEDINFSSLSWDSGLIERLNDHIRLPECSPGKTIFARVRILDFKENYSDWSDPSIIIYTPQKQLEAGNLFVYDLNPTRNLSPEEAFEQAHIVSALQGLANREKPRLFIRWMEADDFWLEKLREPERWMEHVTLKHIESLENLLEEFSSFFNGIVLWDPDVPATSNMASTVAGVENLLPIPKRDVEGSLYRRLVKSGPKLPVKRSLVDMFTGKGIIPETKEKSSGSAKNDAHRWAILKYLETGKSNPARLGYYIDYFWKNNPSVSKDFSNHTLTNHDFFIMKKGFFWDLTVWNDETPVDDKDQPLGTDYETLMRIFHTASSKIKPDEMIHCGGFTPWAMKYTNAANDHEKHGGVQTEWETVRILSAFNTILDADALHLSGMANASIYAHIPKPVRFNQSPPALKEECINNGWMCPDGEIDARTFMVHYVGDYDSAAWLTTQTPKFWNNIRRGEIATPWAWNPNLMERGMPMFDEFIRTRTPEDYLWAGDCGAGYINPTQIFAPRDPSGLPDAKELWSAQCKKWFRMMDIRHVGFLINGRAGNITDQVREMYVEFAGDGIVELDFGDTPDRLYENMPVLRMKNIGLDVEPEKGAEKIRELTKAGEKSFLPIRTVLYSPNYFRSLSRILKRSNPELKVETMRPLEFFYLLRSSLGGKNIRRASFLYDTVPGVLKAGEKISKKIWLRNIGWDSWEKSGEKMVRIAVEFSTVDKRKSPQLITLKKDVNPGEMTEVEFTLQAPSKPGEYYFRIDLLEGKNTWFSEHGNLPESRILRVLQSKM
jgi:putative glycoside hydrolase with GxGYxYP motif/GxGYxY motif-containing protein